MRQVLQSLKTGEVLVQDVPVPATFSSTGGVVFPSARWMARMMCGSAPSFVSRIAIGPAGTDAGMPSYR